MQDHNAAPGGDLQEWLAAPGEEIELEPLRCDDCDATFEPTEIGKAGFWSHACQGPPRQLTF